MDVRVLLCGAVAVDDALARRYYALLDAGERAQVDRLPPERRPAMLLARALVRIELAAVLGVAPGALHFERGVSGKPAVAGAPQLRFNLSHSGEWVALAYLPRPAPTPSLGLGVDLEGPLDGRDLPRLAGRCFGPAEGDRLRAMPAASAEVRFRDRWTLAEAWVKARGASLARELGNPALPAPPPGARGGVRPASAGAPAASWRLLTPAPSLTLALWLEGSASLRWRLQRGLPLRRWQCLGRGA